MSNTLTRYPEDLTGVSLANRITDESHSSPISLTAPYRVIVPTFGPFFVEGFVITDSANPLVPLILGTDFRFAELSEEVTIRTAKETYQTVILENHVLGVAPKISYQTIGGLYTYDTTGIAAEINALIANNNVVDYVALQQKPSQFLPLPHLHAIADAEAGFEPLVLALERLNEIVSFSNNPAFEELKTELIQANAVAAAIGIQAIATHNVSTSAHADIRALLGIATLSPDVGNLLEQHSNGLYYGLASVVPLVAISGPTNQSINTAHDYTVTATIPSTFNVLQGMTYGTFVVRIAPSGGGAEVYSAGIVAIGGPSNTVTATFNATINATGNFTITADYSGYSSTNINVPNIAANSGALNTTVALGTVGFSPVGTIYNGSPSPALPSLAQINANNPGSPAIYNQALGTSTGFSVVLYVPTVNFQVGAVYGTVTLYVTDMSNANNSYPTSVTNAVAISANLLRADVPAFALTDQINHKVYFGYSGVTDQLGLISNTTVSLFSIMVPFVELNVWIPTDVATTGTSLGTLVGTQVIGDLHNYEALVETVGVNFSVGQTYGTVTFTAVPTVGSSIVMGTVDAIASTAVRLNASVINFAFPTTGTYYIYAYYHGYTDVGNIIPGVTTTLTQSATPPGGPITVSQGSVIVSPVLISTTYTTTQTLNIAYPFTVTLSVAAALVVGQVYGNIIIDADGNQLSLQARALTTSTLGISTSSTGTFTSFKFPAVTNNGVVGILYTGFGSLGDPLQILSTPFNCYSNIVVAAVVTVGVMSTPGIIGHLGQNPITITPSDSGTLNVGGELPSILTGVDTFAFISWRLLQDVAFSSPILTASATVPFTTQYQLTGIPCFAVGALALDQLYYLETKVITTTGVESSWSGYASIIRPTPMAAPGYLMLTTPGDTPITLPVGYTTLTVTSVAGGGAGGSYSQNTGAGDNHQGGIGGSGGWKTTTIDITGLTGVVVHVGAGGVANTIAGHTGGRGDASYVANTGGGAVFANTYATGGWGGGQSGGGYWSGNSDKGTNEVWTLFGSEGNDRLDPRYMHGNGRAGTPNGFDYWNTPVDQNRYAGRSNMRCITGYAATISGTSISTVGYGTGGEGSDGNFTFAPQNGTNGVVFISWGGTPIATTTDAAPIRGVIDGNTVSNNPNGIIPATEAFTLTALAYGGFEESLAFFHSSIQSTGFTFNWVFTPPAGLTVTQSAPTGVSNVATIHYGSYAGTDSSTSIGLNDQFAIPFTCNITAAAGAHGGTVSTAISGTIYTDYYYVDNSGGSCFPAGSLVLMADMTQLPIETIKVGDMVMGTNGPVAIVKVDTPILGDRRMISFPDGHRWSEEHAHWTRSIDGAQWWWSYNPDTWKAEVEAGIIGGLKDNDSMRTGDDYQYAHIDGWKTQATTESIEAYNTQLYLPYTNGSPIIVDGYVVGAGVNEANYDYETIDWDQSLLNLKK